MNRTISGRETSKTHAVVGVLDVDVVDRRGSARRIKVAVEAAAPVIDALPPVIAHVRLAGELTMHARPWPRAVEGREVEFRCLGGRTYEALPLSGSMGSGPFGSTERIHLDGKGLTLLGRRAIRGEVHAATGRAAIQDEQADPEIWDERLAERYDLTWAEPTASAFQAAVRGSVVVAAGSPLRESPMPRWWANHHANQISLEVRTWHVNYLRNADMFGLNGLEAAKRYLAARNHGAGPPEIQGEVGFVDPAHLGADDLPELCRILAPWVADRWARHLADLPASLVRHCHDAANYSDAAFPAHEDRIRLLSALAEMMRLSEPLPDVRRGEWPEQAVEALLVRLHGAEGVPRYEGGDPDPVPYAPR
jgi:hypothetical protein